MADKQILHMVTPLRHMSPFDVNMALDAGFDTAIPYTSVTLDDVTGLVQDAIFSRGPEGVKRTGMFIGGKRAIEALDMMKRAKAAMVPPFEISVFADPAGSFTTAAAMVACVKVALKEKFSTELNGKRIERRRQRLPRDAAGDIAGKLAAGKRQLLRICIGEEIGDQRREPGAPCRGCERTPRDGSDQERARFRTRASGQGRRRRGNRDRAASRSRSSL